MKELFDKLVWRKLVWLTQTINVWVFLGHPDETTSSRAYRKNWKWLVKPIDFFLGKGHCERAYLAEQAKVESWKK